MTVWGIVGVIVLFVVLRAVWQEYFPKKNESSDKT